MKVHEVTPAIDADAFLPGAQFIDAFRIAVDGGTLNAREAAERMFTYQPRWVEALMRLRNLIVAPFGLKRSGAGAPGSRGLIGIFPVLGETPQRLVAGFDDSHLDFRVVLDVTPRAGGQDITSTTVVRMNNRLGRIYIAAIRPFHRLVVAGMLRQVAR